MQVERRDASPATDVSSELSQGSQFKKNLKEIIN